MPKILTKDNIHIYYEFVNKKHYPEKPVLVFIHGWIMNWTAFKNEIKFFKKKGFPVIYLDLRGHGKSSKPEDLEDYNLNLMVEDICQVLKNENVNDCILIGHSMGGMVACLFALKNPSLVRKLVLIDSSYKNPLFSSKFRYFRELIPLKFTKLFVRFIAEHTKTRHHLRHLKQWDISKLNSKSEIYIALANFINTPLHSCFAVLEEMFNFDLSKDLTKLKMPALVIASDNDQFFNLRMEKNMHKKIHNSRFLVEKGTHSVIIKRPEEIAAKIDEFIT